MGEVSEKHPLPQGLELKNNYCDLIPGSAKVNLVIENTTRKNVTIPAKAIVWQLNLANKIPKLLLPTSDPVMCGYTSLTIRETETLTSNDLYI